MIHIDGSKGEGGGQVLRTSLTLSLVTGKAFTITKIRAGRKKPGLLRQHLTALRAAQTVGAAEVTGDSMQSTEISFKPNGIFPGHYHFAVGTAGSAGLVLQTVLPALMIASEKSVLTLEGGTHNMASPPFEFLRDSFAPVLAQIGPELDLVLERPGFFPAGGGRYQATITPKSLKSIQIMDRGAVKSIEALAMVSKISGNVAEREVTRLKELLPLKAENLHIRGVKNALGPGNVLLLQIKSDAVTETISGFGQRNVSAEGVAEMVAEEAQTYLDHGAPIGEHLADQLLVPMAIAGGGQFRTGKPSMHLTTNIETIKNFLDVPIAVAETSENDYTVTIG